MWSKKGEAWRLPFFLKEECETLNDTLSVEAEVVPPNGQNSGAVALDRATMNIGPSPSHPSLTHVVAIGASAGGLDTLAVLLPLLVPTGVIAYVIAQHMARDGHAELMMRVLNRHSALPVRLATDGCPLEPDVVYLLPSGVDGEIVSAQLRLVPHKIDALSCPSVTRLFHSLALDFAECGIALVLSGTGSDGAAGCRSVLETGGSVFVQCPDTAQYGGMPQAALDVVGVKHALDVSAMPGAIIDRVAGLRAIVEPTSRSETILINELMVLLHEATGADLRGYKEETLLRRTAKRVQELHLPSLESYLDHVRLHPEEFAVLQKQLFVTVSKFFRDPESFAALAVHLRTALSAASAESKQPFTVWVAGCGAGEEVYSLAMLLHDLRQTEGLDRELRVLGTDLNGTAVAQALTARYSESQVALIPEAYRNRYLTRSGGEYEVAPAIQTLCRFETGDVFGQQLGEPLELVSCRNVLIYLKTQRQESLLQQMYARLCGGGLLFLGQAESLAPAARALFTTLEADHRLFRKRRGLD